MPDHTTLNIAPCGPCQRFARLRLVGVLTDAARRAMRDMRFESAEIDQRLDKPRGWTSERLYGDDGITTLNDLADILYACDEEAVSLRTQEFRHPDDAYHANVK